MKTALEWLEDTLYPYLNKEDKEYTDVLFNKAKEMEKQQIKDAHNHGFTEGTCFGASPIGYKFVESEQYYKETFNQQP